VEQQQHSAFPAPAWRAMTLKIVLLALLYYGAASSGLLLAFEHSNATPVWPPSGIAFGALLLGGWRLWRQRRSLHRQRLAGRRARAAGVADYRRR